MKNTIRQTEKYMENQTNKFTHRKTDRQEKIRKSALWHNFFLLKFTKTTLNAKTVMKKIFLKAR